MLVILLIISTFSSIKFVSCDLVADRLANAQVWIERANSEPQNQLAYTTVVNFSTIYHRVDYAGNFGPGYLALEYDMIVNSLINILGFNSVQLRPKFEISTTQWIAPDILRVDYFLGISAGKFTPQMAYMFDQEDFRFVEFIVFDVSSPLINTGFTVQDKGANTLFTITTGAIPIEIVCGAFVFGACSQINNATNQSYIVNTGYTDVVDCITALTIINAQPNPCPFPQRSDTVACRALHAISSFFVPAIHCAHTKKVSPVCNAQCLPACANCHTDATCLATYANDFPFNKASYAPVYKCTCNNGFSGNGLTCAPLVCATSPGNSNNSNRICPTSIAGSTECINNLCKCRETFTNQPLTPTDHCGCPEPAVVRTVNKQPICVPAGRCITDDARYICNLQEYNQVKCRTVNNTFNPFGVCQCNPGFTGGIEYPCLCAHGKRIVWSNSVDGSVCLATNECTSDFDCESPQVCHLVANQKIGVCGV